MGVMGKRWYDMMSTSTPATQRWPVNSMAFWCLQHLGGSGIQQGKHSVWYGRVQCISTLDMHSEI
jgi:hypothetical protein